MAADTTKDSYDGAEFTWDSYRKILRKAKSEYNIRHYDDFSKEESFLLVRHDVDFSMHAALHMAKMEAEEGVSSTFFVLPHCIFYNLLEREITEIIHEIRNLGHHFGLHFDSHYYVVEKGDDLHRLIEREHQFLRDMLGIEAAVFSFHNTTPFTMECLDWTYGGLINTYADYFQDEVTYCSDSNGYWRHQRAIDVLDAERNPRLQLLFHPTWWHKKSLYPRQKIYECAYGRARATMQSYDATLEQYGRRNLGRENGDG